MRGKEGVEGVEQRAKPGEINGEGPEKFKWMAGGGLGVPGVQIHEHELLFPPAENNETRVPTEKLCSPPG